MHAPTTTEQHRLECEARYWIKQARIKASRAIAKGWDDYETQADQKRAFGFYYKTAMDALLTRIEKKRHAEQPMLRAEIRNQMAQGRSKALKHGQQQT